MNLEIIKAKLPDYAVDIKLNLDSHLERILSDKFTMENIGLTAPQIKGIALAAAYATKDIQLIQLTLSILKNDGIEETTLLGVKAAVAIMAMNNTYYRSTHLMQESMDFGGNSGLRMNIIRKPGIDKQDFELYCLTVSAINGCGLCLSSHANILLETGLKAEAIQHSLRIASIFNAISQIFTMEAIIP
jgi:lipoyl-dependent peroxiredoxin subunit D